MKTTDVLKPIFALGMVVFLTSCPKTREDCLKEVKDAIAISDSDLDSILFTSKASYLQKGYDSLVFIDKNNQRHVFKFIYEKGFIPANPIVDRIFGGCVNTVNKSYFNAIAKNPNCRINSIVITNINESAEYSSIYNSMSFAFKNNERGFLIRSDYVYYKNKYDTFGYTKSSTVIKNTTYTGILQKADVESKGELKEIFYIKNFIPAYIYFNDDTLYNANL